MIGFQIALGQDTVCKLIWLGEKYQTLNTIGKTEKMHFERIQYVTRLQATMKLNSHLLHNQFQFNFASACIVESTDKSSIMKMPMNAFRASLT